MLSHYATRMNINIYLEDELALLLTNYAKKTHKKKNTIIREAIRNWLQTREPKQWPSSILEFTGIKEFPDINELRQDLPNLKEDLF